ncbi:MAG TPA: hypothetical protein VFV83_01060, partial [Chthoniobacteraceae bacterium]|nr:hypothetical protein [Chthoniobacteraceae bacterium]
MSALFIIAMLATAPERSPAEEVRAAAIDAATVPAEVRHGVRYLTLYNLDPSRRDETERAVSYVLNALSRSRVISKPRQVSPTLLRFDISQYAPDKKEFQAWFDAWEQLIEVDPYFHLRTEVLVGKAIKSVTTDGGWVGLENARELHRSTGSAGAILRADFFLAHATIPPHYHNFAGIPATENEFLKSLGVDRDVIVRLRANAGANLVISGVTGKPRRVIWSQGPLGGVYATLDVQAVDATRDPLRRPVSAEGLELKYDASEWFAVAPNGMWRTAIFNAEGKRQDAVPDRVAKDTSDPHGDGIIVP